MKNFKKVLALVLAVATLLSFATIASAVSSSSYKDAADITKNGQTEAIDVLSGIGVLTGYPDTTFKPNQDITRAEAAKIIAMFDNGATDISALYKSANPFTLMRRATGPRATLLTATRLASSPASAN
jgi:Spy/CpxP family protein refolding chaperone